MVYEMVHFVCLFARFLDSIGHRELAGLLITQFYMEFGPRLEVAAEEAEEEPIANVQRIN